MIIDPVLIYIYLSIYTRLFYMSYHNRYPIVYLECLLT